MSNLLKLLFAGLLGAVLVVGSEFVLYKTQVSDLVPFVYVAGSCNDEAQTTFEGYGFTQDAANNDFLMKADYIKGYYKSLNKKDNTQCQASEVGTVLVVVPK